MTVNHRRDRSSRSYPTGIILYEVHFMLFDIHIHNHVDVERLLKEITSLNTKLNNIMSKLDDLKAKFAAQDVAIDGLQADLTFIKGKLANAENGLTAAEVDELNTLIDARTAKLQDLDAQTDSTEPQP